MEALTATGSGSRPASTEAAAETQKIGASDACSDVAGVERLERPARGFGGRTAQVYSDLSGVVKDYAFPWKPAPYKALRERKNEKPRAAAILHPANFQHVF